jgi:putative membrane protein
MRLSKAWLAVALLTAGVAQAEIKIPRPGNPPPAGQPPPPAGQPPRPGQPGAPPAPSSQDQAGLSSEQQQGLGVLNAENRLAIQAAQTASQRAASGEVKQMAQKMGQDHQRIQQQLQQLASERHIDLNKLPRATQREQEFAHRMQRWQSLSGPDFDRAFTSDMEALNVRWEQEMKDLRERTPGADAHLKKWLDDVENVAEDHKTLARKTQQAIGRQGQQVQARTPSGR